MNDTEIKALLTLLDDEDREIVEHVEGKLKHLGGIAIPYLEDRWEESSLNPILQKKIEDIIHDLQYHQIIERLVDWKSRGSEDLLEAMWIIATYQYPDLHLEKLRQHINDMYFDAWLEFRENMHPNDQVRILNHVFFDKHKFQPNTKNFHSPVNSMINQVFDMKRGNPISLCIIYLSVAKRLGMPVFGVNLPSLFILTFKTPQVQFYINVFNKGLIFTKKDIDNYVKQMHLQPNEAFYEPCTNHDIVCRVLRNLIISFEKLSNIERVREIEEILNAIL